VPDHFDHMLKLIFCQLWVNRERENLVRCPFRNGEIPLMVAKVFEALLKVKG
jgi:hypothetical protein